MISALLLLAAAQPDQLAHISRFYKPGATPSSLELYLSSMDGTKSRKLAMEQTPIGVSWLGKDRLAVHTQVGVYVGSIKSWKPKLVMETAYYQLALSENRTSAPGVVQLAKYEDGDNAILNAKTLKIDPMDYSKVPEPLDAVDGKYSVTEPNGAALTLEFGKSIEFPGKSTSDKRSYFFQRGWNMPKGAGKQLFLLANSESLVSDENLNSMLLLEKSKKPRVLFGYADSFDFWFQRPTFAYTTKQIETPLNPKNKKSSLVLTNELRVGDWTKGTERKVFNGPVRTVSVAIRP